MPAYAGSLSGQLVDESVIVEQVRQFASCIREAAKNYRAVFVVSWTIPAYHRGNGLNGLRNQGIRRLLLRMNLTLAEELDNLSTIYFMDGQRWIESTGKNAYSPKLWYLTKTPFQVEVFRRATSDFKAAISSLLGLSKKLVVVDLDNTLWGGVLGDLGWENIRLGGHDYLGEAFVDFQKALKTLSSRGIILAISSRNEESVALEALSKHPEMILRPSDFVAWRINWNDKAANIADIITELNLGAQSVVFIDDNPVERARVKEALPEVFVPDWPEDKTLYASRLLELDCFDSSAVTAEDRARNQAYAAERQRELHKTSVGSAEEWLLSLGTEVTAEELNEANLVRVAQLLNKTNQMNLSTRRLSESELQGWLAGKGRALWAFRVRDKFGDSGLTGILSVEIDGGTARLVDFVLSCRVMGRNVERAMVAFAARHCARMNAKDLQAVFIPTAKNKPCLSFWQSSGFSCDESSKVFRWSLDSVYDFPAGVEMISKEAGEEQSDASGKKQISPNALASISVLTE